MNRSARLLVALLALIGIIIAVAVWMGTRESNEGRTGSVIDFSDTSVIQRGQYLAQIGNCMGCHTAPGGAPYAGGRAIPTPYGTFFGPNITPDPTTGIGEWSADDFWRALHNGKGRDGRLLYPAFPYPTYTYVSRADADALFAFLRSLPSVEQANQAHELQFPYSQRWLLSFWRAAHFRPGQLEPEAGQSEQWLRGRYLVEGLAHCAECHTPRSRWGGLDHALHLQGGVIPGLNWYATPLTGDQATGLGNWSVSDIAQLLQSGLSAHSHVAGPMAESVYWGYQFLTDEDALAIGTYLKTLPAAGVDGRAARGAKASTTLLDLGQQVYEESCVQCHKADGRGEPGAWPPLAGNPSVLAVSSLNVLRAILDGGFPPTTSDNPRPHGMPPYRHVLNDTQLAAVASYVRSAWGNNASGVSIPEARRIREASR